MYSRIILNLELPLMSHGRGRRTVSRGNGIANPSILFHQQTNIGGLAKQYRGVADAAAAELVGLVITAILDTV